MEWHDVIVPQLDLDDVDNARRYIKNAMTLLATLVDAAVPSVSGWSSKNGGAAKLKDNTSSIGVLSQTMTSCNYTAFQARGWTAYAAATATVAALFAFHRTEKAVETCLEHAKEVNDDLRVRMHRRELSVNPEVPLCDVPRKDVADELKYKTMKEYLINVDVFAIVADMNGEISRAVFENEKPNLYRYVKELKNHRQAWRVSKDEQLENERRVRAREIEDEENGEWALV